MAQIYNPWDNEKDKQKQQQQVGTFNAGTTSSAAPQQKTQPTQKPQGSGLFTNIQKFANQNQGLGQQVGANVQNQANQASDKFTNIQSQFEKQKEGLQGTLQQGQQFQQQLQQDPTKIQDVNTFRNLAQGALQQDVQGLSQYGQQAGDVQQKIGQTLQDVGTEQGRFGLLKNMFGGKKYGTGYSQGQQTLDQALLQTQAGDLTNQINAAKAQQLALQDKYNALTGNITNAQTELGTQVGDVQKSLTGTLTEQQKAIQAANEAEKQAAIKTLPTQYQKLIEEAKKGNYDKATFDQLGLTPILRDLQLTDKFGNTGMFGLGGADLGQYLKGTSEADIAGKDWKQFLDQSEAAKLSALSNLSINPNLGQTAEQYQAGQKIDPFAWTNEGAKNQLQKDVEKRFGEYKKDYSEITGQDQYKKAATNVQNTSALADAIEKLQTGKINLDQFQKLAQDRGLISGDWFQKESGFLRNRTAPGAAGSEGLEGSPDQVINPFDETKKQIQAYQEYKKNPKALDAQIKSLQNQLKYGDAEMIQPILNRALDQKKQFSSAKNEQDFLNQTMFGKQLSRFEKQVGSNLKSKQNLSYQQYQQALQDLAEKYGQQFTQTKGSQSGIQGIGDQLGIKANTRFSDIFGKKG